MRVVPWWKPTLRRVDVGGDEVIVVLAQRGVAADLDDAFGPGGDLQQAADLVERQRGVELHVAGVVLLFERALGFDAAGAEIDAGALDVDGLVVGRGGDVGGEELRAGAEVERDVEAGDAARLVERDRGVDVRGGMRRGAARLSISPEMTIFDCGVSSCALVSVILSFSIVSGQLHVDVDGRVVAGLEEERRHVDLAGVARVEVL